MADKYLPHMALHDDTLRGLIYTVRGLQVMLDSDLAKLYGVQPKRLNEQVKRNLDRFPDEFRFQLSQEEFDSLRSQSATAPSLRSQIATSSDAPATGAQSSRHGGRRYLPYVFTEQGVAMLSAVLHSETAIQTSISIIRAFVEMRNYIAQNGGLLRRMDSIEKRQISHELVSDKQFEKLFNALENRPTGPTQGVFFDGQTFDAYVFINGLIRQAKKSIVLIDNYVDDSVLVQLSKRQGGVSASILCKTIGKVLAQDLKKHNAQYPEIKILEFNASHDRFLILDQKEVYHIGASLKDLGEKWFAFSNIDKSALKFMEKLEEVLPNEH